MAAAHQEIQAEIPYLRRYARALVRDVGAADDLVQNGLTRALAKLHLWQEGTNLRAWLVTILRNQHIDDIRRTLRAGRSVELSEAERLLTQPAEQDKRLELRDLDRVLARLPEEQRAVIILVGLKGMAYQDAGELLGMKVGTVRSRLSRGRDALRRLMSDGLDPPAERPRPLPGMRIGDRSTGTWPVRRYDRRTPVKQ
jgi:RNA polymerase sigma-70 factor (ECF subfamily)